MTNNHTLVAERINYILMNFKDTYIVDIVTSDKGNYQFKITNVTNSYSFGWSFNTILFEDVLDIDYIAYIMVDEFIEQEKHYKEGLKNGR